MKRLYPIILSIFVISFSCMAAETDLLLLKDKDIVLGVKAEIGGRVMLFRRTDGENILHSNPKHWALSDAEIPPARNTSEFKEFQGHIVWIGPINKWWKDQTGNLQPPGPGFFPDPYLIYDRSSILEHTKSKLILEGNTSPLNGMKMTKEFNLIGNSKVQIKITVINKRNRPVTWNIWSNTRFNPAGKCWFEIGKRGNLRLDFSAWSPLQERPLGYEISNGKCYFKRPDNELLKKYDYFGKLLFNNYLPIYATYGDNLFIKTTTCKMSYGPAPEGTLPLEIFQRYSSDSSKNIMELEYQSPTFTLQSDESYSFTETWQLKKIDPNRND